MSGLNIVQLDNLQTDLGEDSFKGLLNVFMGTADEDLDKLLVAMKDNNAQDVIATAHRMKSNFRTFGLDALGQILDDIENAADPISPENLSHVEKMQDEFHNNYKVELKKYL